ncbi:MAG TPA: dienelactone hydrolase family protein [Humibacillus sp.]|nr:dienelactone hydrolase family protein [Humibacillus sp.]
MAEVLLFHHAQGLTPGLLDVAEAVRSAGHIVHTPDLYDGRTFATIDEGIAHARSVGFASLHEHASAVAAELPEAVVYAGFSLGVMDAQRLAQTRPGAVGAVLLDSCAPLGEFAPGWPSGVPVQIHGGAADSFFMDEGDIEAARQVVEAADDGELFTYAGCGHLFADPSAEAYDPDAAALVQERILAFLARL